MIDRKLFISLTIEQQHIIKEDLQRKLSYTSGVAFESIKRELEWIEKR